MAQSQPIGLDMSNRAYTGRDLASKSGPDRVGSATNVVLLSLLPNLEILPERTVAILNLPYCLLYGASTNIRSVGSSPWCSPMEAGNMCVQVGHILPIHSVGIDLLV